MRQVSLEVPNLSELLSSVMAEPGFQVLGTTGTVAFSSRGDPRYPSFDIVNFQGEGLLTVGSFVGAALDPGLPFFSRQMFFGISGPALENDECGNVCKQARMCFADVMGQ